MCARDNQPFKSGVEKYSGHAFSVDGVKWTYDESEPIKGTVQYTNGANKTFATRERHQMVFADRNRTTPVGITSGVSPQPLGPWCDQCSEGACSQCKVTPGRDWTYTIYQDTIAAPAAAAAANRPGVASSEPAQE